MSGSCFFLPAKIYLRVYLQGGVRPLERSNLLKLFFKKLEGASFVLLFIIGLLVIPPFSVYSEEADEITISGKVIWAGHDLTRASVSVFKDPEFRELQARVSPLKPEGTYALKIDAPGTYYIVAFVDDNGNGRFDAGDGMGIYGVKDRTDQAQEPKPLRLEKGAKLVDVDIPITALVDAQGQMTSISASRTATGISGKLIWHDHKFPNAIVFVYADPSWNRRIAQTRAAETGEYEISVPAGRYYLLAVIDENNSDLLDAGDKFGIWGMTRFGTFPKAVRVENGIVAKDRNILITGQIDPSGKPLSLAGQVEKAGVSEDKITLSGTVIWHGHSVKNGLVQAYGDPSMTVPVAQAKTDDKGSFRLVVPVGDYYIMAGVDADGDGKYTKGDGIGAYGVTDAANQMPEKFTADRSSQNSEINLVITAEFDDSGQLKTISRQKQIPAGAFAGLKPEEEAGDKSATGVSGKIVWEDRKVTSAILVFSSEPGFKSGIRVPLQLSDDGSYICSTPPGDYYIMVLVDCNDNGQIDSGDGTGFYGTGYLGSGCWGDPQRVTVLEGRTTPYVNISVTGMLGRDGKPIQTRSGIRSYYGDPDSVYDTGDTTQEWWYWTKGIAFTFEKTDTGWDLIDTYEFNPKDTSSKKQTNRENSKGTIYYAFDGNVWAIDADNTNKRWIAFGDQVTGTLNGDKLISLDRGRNLNFINPGSDDTAQGMMLTYKEAGLQPAMSHDGKVIAFTREKGGQMQIYIKSLGTGEENEIPSGNMNQYNPAWSPDDELIAYAAAPYSSSPLSRDIYYYDLVSGRTERVSASPLDEFDPAWSPVDKHVLVYCRAEGDHAQICMVSFDANGKPVERQLTKYGGQSPAWSPKGDKIIYENNAQLWTISPDGSNESPVLVNGEPVFGLKPFWTQ